MAVMATNEPVRTSDADAPRPRIRLIIDTTERIRKAVQRKAQKLTLERFAKVSPSDFLNEILEDALSDELQEIDRLESKGRKKKGE